ncbi:hypothetical protein [Paenibacillus hunanensis]|uniref:hypothetical protein n=1 Tax=Paenibacillus hunanensis TaxID=539262 RepID=UPI00286A945D|nr:hypothetical protein [Paenibacillus hunanensis]
MRVFRQRWTFGTFIFVGSSFVGSFKHRQMDNRCTACLRSSLTNRQTGLSKDGHTVI